jgi:MerR family transcriptional regulator, light-induced transcriptional regulator
VTYQPPTAQPPSKNSPEGDPPSTPTAGLTIGELSRRTGVNVATLRMWEARHGFPRVVRLPSGHRRYDERTVELVQQVQRRREAGARLEAAISAVAATPDIPPSSVYAELARRHPGLLPRRLRKSTLLALTWALEDECCARAQRPWLFGAFQDERFYRQAEPRWRDLARTTQGAWALARFADPAPATPTAPVEVDLPETSPMTREWSLVCLAPDLPAALAAWELPGQEGTPDGERLFEALWTLDPVAVRDAGRACARLVAELGHDTAGALEAADDPRPPTAVELQQATGLFNRVLAYVDRVR